MKISAKCAYGIRLVLELSIHYGKAQKTLKEISAAQDISEKYLSQIMIPLRNAGFIQSSRGAKGGYYLTASPANITLGDIFAVLEDGFNTTDSNAGNLNSDHLSVQLVQEVWGKLKNQMDDFLYSMSFQQLVQDYREKVANETFCYVI